MRNISRDVAPHVGAWIETLIYVKASFLEMSLPMWERGLKQYPVRMLVDGIESLPMWERGLKQLNLK